MISSIVSINLILCIQDGLFGLNNTS